MKQIREFMDHTEGLIAKDYLEVNGVHSELHGAKDYSTHVVGGTQGRYFLSVDDEQTGRAQELLARTNVKIATMIEHPTEISEVALKKSVTFALMAMFLLPFVGTWISIHEATIYARITRNSTRKWVWLTLISWLQVPGVVIAWILIKSLLTLTRVVEIGE